MDAHTRTVVEALAGWDGAPGPRYHRLAVALGELIDRFVVPPGERLPAERTLAAALGVGRNTVVAAYDELAAAGLVVRRQGSGTTARRPHRGAPTPGRDNPAAFQLRRRLAGASDVIDLSLSMPGDVDHLPHVDEPTLHDLSTAGSGLHPLGLPELREAVASHLTTQLSLPTTPGQVVITTGAQQALSLAAAAAVRPGVPVLLPCPTYPGSVAVFGRAGGRLVPLPTDSAGVHPQAVERALVTHPHAVAFLMTGGDNPAGAVLGHARREHLRALVEQHDVFVIEDLTLAGLLLDPTAACPRPLAAESGRVIAVGSVSKLLWAGLRVGWARVDGPMAERFYRLKAAADLACGVADQRWATALLRAVDDPWLADRRTALAARRDHLRAELARCVPDLEPNLPDAGLSLWVAAPPRSGAEGADTDGLARTAAAHGVAVMPGSPACHQGHADHLDHVRLSFADPPEVLTVGVERLAAAWDEHRSR